MSISINMKFWDDGQPNSTRIRNVKFCWDELKRVTNFLKGKEIIVDCFLYDFSPSRIIDDSIHIPYPIGTYKKAEKTNLILKERKTYDYFMMMDCDAFFYDEDYDNLLNLINNLQKGDVITFDLAKLNDNVDSYLVNDKFIKSMADWSYAYSGNRENGPLHQYLGGLGGVYISDTKLLIDLGGFDEKYIGWGGEDGDMLGRIWASEITHRIIPTKNFAPYHLPHYYDWSNKNYSQRFE